MVDLWSIYGLSMDYLWTIYTPSQPSPWKGRAAPRSLPYWWILTSDTLLLFLFSFFSPFYFFLSIYFPCFRTNILLTNKGFQIRMPGNVCFRGKWRETKVISRYFPRFPTKADIDIWKWVSGYRMFVLNSWSWHFLTDFGGCSPGWRKGPQAPRSFLLFPLVHKRVVRWAMTSSSGNGSDCFLSPTPGGFTSLLYKGR